MSFIVAQIFGLTGLAFTIIANYQNKKSKILIFQILANTLCFVQYVLLSALAAASTYFVAVIRSLVFYDFDKREKKKSKLILLLFFILILILGMCSYKDLFSFIPLITALFFTYGVWQDNLKIFRIIAFLVPVAWIAYNIHVGAYIGVVLTIIEALATLFAIIKIDIKKEKNEGKTKLLMENFLVENKEEIYGKNN